MASYSSTNKVLFVRQCAHWCNECYIAHLQQQQNNQHHEQQQQHQVYEPEQYIQYNQQQQEQQQVYAPVASYDWRRVLVQLEAGATTFEQDIHALQQPDALQPYIDHQVRAPCAYCRKKNKEVRPITLFIINTS